jgi:integrase
MARGHIRKKTNGRWIARFPTQGRRGSFTSRSFDRKVDADRWLADQNSSWISGTWVDPSRAGELFGSVAESWLSSRRDVAASTWARDDSYLRNLILPFLGELQLREVTVEALDEWVGLLAERRAPNTVRKAFGITSQILDRAVATRKLPANPARVREGITLPAVESREMRFLTTADVDALADAIDPWYRSLVLAGAYTGCRWGELVGLKAKNLDLSAGRLTVVESLSEVGSDLRLKDPKTPTSRRTIALPTALVDVLGEHLAGRPVVGDGLVFTDTAGNPLRRSNFRRRAWRPAVAASVGEPMRFHDLRHTHAAWLIANGEHPKTIQTRLGHASISTTLDRYGHLMAGLDEGAAARLDRLAADPGKHGRSTRPNATVSDLSARKTKTQG